MSETQPVTKIYLSKSDESALRESFPEHSNDYMSSAEARKVRSESQVYGVYHSRGDKFGFGISTKDGKHFDLECSGWEESQFTPEFDQRLAQEIEQLVGQVGLSIILY